MVHIDEKWTLNEWRHLVASSEEELHEFALKIGLKREWFQKRRDNQPHYDIKGTRIQKALDNGAIEIGRKELVEFLKQNYK